MTLGSIPSMRTLTDLSSDNTRTAILDARAAKSTAGGPSFSRRNRLQRALWRVAWALLAAWTPPALYPWRAFVLRCFGARVARTAVVRASVRIWYPPFLTMEDRATL